jgi:hypothetical protein
MKRWMFPIVGLLLLLAAVRVSAGWFGLEDCPSHWAVASGYADACRFQAPANAVATRLEIRTYGPGGSKATFRMAVYDDQNDRPQSRLWEGTDVSYQAGEWCGEEVEGIQLIQDAYYWFAFKTGEPEEMCFVPDGPSSSHEWKAGQAYADTFPNPWGNYSGHNANRYTMRMHYAEAEGGTEGIIEIDAGIIEGGFVR